MMPVRAAILAAIRPVPVSPMPRAVVGPPSMTEPAAAAAIVTLVDRELRDWTRRGGVPFLSRQRRADELTVGRPRIPLAIVRLVRWGCIVFDDCRRQLYGFLDLDSFLHCRFHDTWRRDIGVQRPVT
jgi:hypothetical protein